MALLSRVSTAASRTGASVRIQFFRLHIADKSKSSLRRSASTEATQSGSSNTAKSRLNGIGNFLLGTTLAGAGAGTVFFTYLRVKNSGIGVAANTIMDDGLHPAAYPWPNNHPFASFDHNR
jgi:ubiquinol-cytochrome c reductase cytochrome c1 subunit